MKVAVEDGGDEHDFPFSSPSSSQTSSAKPRQQRTRQQQQQQQLYPSWQRGPLLLNDLGGSGRLHDRDPNHRRNPSSFSNLTATLPGLLTPHEGNMSKLGPYSSDDDSGDEFADKDGDKNAAGHGDEQPSTGRTEAVSEFSNLAGTSAIPSKKSVAGERASVGRALELVSSYSTVGYAGWSKFALSTSDGEEEEEDGSTSFEQNKPVSAMEATRDVHPLMYIFLFRTYYIQQP